MIQKEKINCNKSQVKLIKLFERIQIPKDFLQNGSRILAKLRKKFKLIEKADSLRVVSNTAVREIKIINEFNDW